MRIAVDTRFFQSEGEFYSFTKEIFYRLAILHKTHQFIFLFDKQVEAVTTLPENVTSVVVTSKPEISFLYKWWYDVKVSFALKKHKADVFVATYGKGSLTTAVPQVLIVKDLDFLKYPKHTSFSYKKLTPVFLKKAEAIITFSNFLKQQIIGTYKISEQKIIVIDRIADRSFRPLHWHERETVKEQYAQGCEYFVFTENDIFGIDLVNLLKAFSIFKKWQKTNMKLVISTNLQEYHKDQSEKLNAYKYRNEIFFAKNLSIEEKAKLIGGAYAIISLDTEFGSGVLEAMQCEVAAITADEGTASEIAEEAALRVSITEPAEIAEQMKRIYKDEQLRNKLIAAGKERIKLYNWDRSATIVWQVIEKAVSK